MMSRAEVDTCLDALPAGLTLMCGVLVSEKTLRGERNRWWKRYAPIDDIAGIFSDEPRCLNLIHYCSDRPPSAEVIGRLVAIGGPHLHGFQFNGAWPDAWSFRMGTNRAALHVVLQARPGADIAEMRTFLATIADGKRHVLIDASGGRGEPIDPTVARATARLFRRENGYWINLGIAGGLCAETLPAIGPVLREYDVSIDAEGRLRDGDEGGTLTLDKARSYLKVAGEIMAS
jgi:hypothetical protein